MRQAAMPIDANRANQAQHGVWFRVPVALWQRLGSINLSIVLCLLLAADLIYGYFCLNRRSALFTPLGDMGLYPWLQTYGYHNLPYTGWFFLLLLLLALLCLNTFACTTKRVAQLLAQRGTTGHFGKLTLLFRLSPHIMHYGLIVLLAGILCSYLFSQVLPGVTLVPGSAFSLPGTGGTLRFLAFEPLYYEGERLDFMKNHVLAPRARVLLQDEQGQREGILGYNQPLRFQGYSIHLHKFAPKTRKGGMNLKTRIDLSLRKDPGIAFYLSGMGVFVLGMLLYVSEFFVSFVSRKSA